MRRPRARPEEVTGELAVNERILSALHGLDGEALRNSCFVEQRALDRVEALSRAAREEAIAKLLGLERLVGIERDLTPSAQDHAQVERARIEVSVAERSRAALEAQTREAQASVALRGARVRAVVAQRESLAQQHGEHERQGQAMRERSSELEGRIARAGQVAALLATLDAMEQELSAGRESEATAAQLRATLADLDRIEREQLPAGQARVAELRDLEARLVAAEQARADLQHAQQMQRVAELDERLGQFDALIPALDEYETAQRTLALTHDTHRLARDEENARTAVAQHDAALAQAQVDARDTQAAVDRANLRDILAYWLRLKEIQELRRGEHEVTKITLQRDKLALKVARLHQREVVESVLAMIGALTAIGSMIGYARGLASKPFPVLLITGVAVVLVWLIGVPFPRDDGRRAARRTRATRVRAATQSGQHPHRGGQSARRLRRRSAAGGGGPALAGAAVPPDLQIGRSQLASLVSAEPGQLVDLEEAARQVMLRGERTRVELASAQAQLEVARRERAERDLMRDLPVAAIETQPGRRGTGSGDRRGERARLRRGAVQLAGGAGDRPGDQHRVGGPARARGERTWHRRRRDGLAGTGAGGGERRADTFADAGEQRGAAAGGAGIAGGCANHSGGARRGGDRGGALAGICGQSRRACGADRGGGRARDHHPRDPLAGDSSGLGRRWSIGAAGPRGAAERTR